METNAFPSVYIICSAIHFDDGKEHIHQPRNISSGYVVSGRRHHNCFMTLKILLDNNDKTLISLKETQGFLTSDDRFVDREEAALIAYEAGQTTDIKKKLYSEDIY